MLRIILPVVLLAVVAYFSLFRVQEYEQAIVFQFREIQRSDYEPGLHYMIPVVNTVKKFEKRLLNLDREPQRFLTVREERRHRRLLRKMVHFRRQEILRGDARR